MSVQKTATNTATVTFGFTCRTLTGSALPAAAKLLTCVLPHHLDAKCSAPTVLSVRSSLIRPWMPIGP